MTATRKMTKKRFAPAANGLFFSSSDISGLLSDSDEDTTQKQEQGVEQPQKLVHGDETGAHPRSSNPLQDTNNIFISISSLPPPAVSKLSEQDKQQIPKAVQKDLTRNERDNKKMHGRPKELNINMKNMNTRASSSSDEDGLMFNERMRSSTSEKNGHAGPVRKVLPSVQGSIHIVTDSEEEVIETQSNKNSRTQRTVTQKGLLLDKSSLQSAFNSDDPHINTVMFVHQDVVTSTPLQKARTMVSVSSSLPSPVTPAMSPPTVKTRRGKGSQAAESEKMFISAEKDLDQAVTVPGFSEEREKKDDDSKSHRTVNCDKVGDHLTSSSPPQYTNSIVISVSPLPSLAISKLSQQDKQQMWKAMQKDLRRNESDIEELHGRPKELNINMKNMNMRASSLSDEDGLEVNQRMRSSTSEKNGHAGPARKVLPSVQGSNHTVTDSEGKVFETQSNKNSRTQRTVTQKGLLPDKNSLQSAVSSDSQHISTVTYVHQHVVTSTPLRKTGTSVTVSSSLPSSITSAVPPSTVNTRGKGSQVAESEKVFLSAQKHIDQAVVVPGCYEEREKKDDFKKRKSSFRKLYTPKGYEEIVDEEAVVIFSAEKHSELKSGLSANLGRRSSNRRNITTTRSIVHYSRKSSGLRSRTPFGEQQVKFRAEESAYDGRQLSPNHGVMENAQEITADKGNMGSSNIDEIKHKNKRANRSHQKKKTSKLEHNDIPGGQKKSHVSAVAEGKAKNEPVLKSEFDLRRSTRHRVKPVEYWRGERVRYKTGADMCREVAGIDPGFPSRQWVHASERPAPNKRKRVQFPQEDTKESNSRKLVLVPYGNGKCELECFSTFRVDSDVTECVNGNFTVYTGLEVPGISAGYIEISPFCELCSVFDSDFVSSVFSSSWCLCAHEQTHRRKKLPCSHFGSVVQLEVKEQTSFISPFPKVFYTLVGKLTVTIHETTRKVNKGEFFFVPKDVSHTLRNDAEVKALLVFTKYGD